MTGQVQQYTVGTLPAASTNNGTILWVKDSNTTTVGASCAGSGTNYVPCQSNGTNWLVQSVGTSSSAAAAGSNTAVQYNASGSLGGDATNFNYNATTHLLTVSGGIAASGATAGLLQLGQGTANTCGANAVCLQSPTSVTASYTWTLPGTDSSGVLSVASDVVSVLATTGSGNVVRATSPTLTTPVLGVATATSINGTTIPTSATLGQMIASGTAALGTAAIASGACATAVTATATGTATTDVIVFSPNADITAVTGYTPSTSGGLSIYPYPTANTVNFKVCNPTASSITPGAVTLNWRVAR